MKIVKKSVSDEETQYSPKSDKWYLINVWDKKLYDDKCFMQNVC